MRILLAAIAMAGLAIGSFTHCLAAVFSQTYSIAEWNTDVANHSFVDVSVELGFGVTAVDSIWIEISGLSHTGSSLHYDGMIGIPIACHDLLFVSFINEPSQGDCGDTFVPPDGTPDCIGSSYASTSWPDVPFVATRYMSAIERANIHTSEFIVLDPRPPLGDLFSDGIATLRFREIDGGSSTWPCIGGLADIVTMTVNVAYDSALPTESESWGGLKATFR